MQEVEGVEADVGVDAQRWIEGGAGHVDVELCRFQAQLGLTHIGAVLQQVRRHARLQQLGQRCREHLQIPFDVLRPTTDEEVDAVLKHRSLLLQIEQARAVLQDLGFKTLHRQLRHARRLLLLTHGREGIGLDRDVALHDVKLTVEGGEFVVRARDLGDELRDHEVAGFEARPVARVGGTGGVSQLAPDVDFPRRVQTDLEVR